MSEMLQAAAEMCNSSPGPILGQTQYSHNHNSEANVVNKTRLAARVSPGDGVVSTPGDGRIIRHNAKPLCVVAASRGKCRKIPGKQVQVAPCQIASPFITDLR
ncbi:hypothetical protein Zmor_009704 [Zophobas morio]|uniref:Uncharacterized protein n=1 Tax=Zophobas morio TaxID=2755281 RepID=A0AA38IHC4_9CUCU|nr:hypothetical protein Zmor_009704 [Zophobas morio]